MILAMRWIVRPALRVTILLGALASCGELRGQSSYLVSSRWESTVCLTNTQSKRTDCGRADVDKQSQAGVKFRGQEPAWYRVGSCVKGSEQFAVTVHGRVDCPSEPGLAAKYERETYDVVLFLRRSESPSEFARIAQLASDLSTVKPHPFRHVVYDPGRDVMAMTLTEDVSEGRVREVVTALGRDEAIESVRRDASPKRR